MKIKKNQKFVYIFGRKMKTEDYLIMRSKIYAVDVQLGNDGSNYPL